MLHPRITSSLTNGNVVVVVDANEVTKLQVTSSRGGLGSDTLHGAPIAEEAVGVVCGDIKAGLIKNGTGVSLSDGKTDSVGKTLSEGTSGDFDTRSIVSLGVAGCDGVERLRCVSGNGLSVIFTAAHELTRNALMSSMEMA